MNPTPIPIQDLPEPLRRHVGADAPMPLRMMAARGMVPAGPTESLMLLHQLSLDTDGAVREAAVGSLSDMPEEVIGPAIAGVRHAQVLATIAHWRREEELLAQIVQHPKVDDGLVAELARRGSTWLCDVIADNEVRLLRTPKIIESLYLNEQARMSMVHRIVELARRNKVEFSQLPALRAMTMEMEEDSAEMFEEELAEERDGTFALFLQESLLDDDEDDEDDEDAPEEVKEEKKKRKGNRAAEIDSMSLSEKIRLGTLGSGGDREILIRHSNRLVHMSAVSSPKVQPKEIHGWAGNKSLPDNVISYIANHREYSRNYQILVKLMNNPKMPFQIATRKLTQLNKNDLKKLPKNRNISPQLQRLAKVMLEQMEKKKR